MGGSSVLVTGASGLLGSAIVQRLNREDIGVIGLCNRHAVSSFQSVDLSDPAAVQELNKLSWDAAIHCAAYRSPDFCELNRDAARVLNAEAPGRLAALAAARHVPFIHISTDYVFPGEHPPYTEESVTSPINYYGVTKRQAELAVLNAHGDALVARVPALYGAPPPPAVSAMLQEGIEGAKGDGVLELDDVTVRFPTHVDDVAEALVVALARSIGGLLHVSAGESATRFAWTRRITEWMGRDVARLRPGPRVSGRPAVRPVNSQLAIGRLRELGLPVPRPFSAVLPKMLKSMGLVLK